MIKPNGNLVMVWNISFHRVNEPQNTGGYHFTHVNTAGLLLEEELQLSYLLKNLRAYFNWVPRDPLYKRDVDYLLF